MDGRNVRGKDANKELQKENMEGYKKRKKEGLREIFEEGGKEWKRELLDVEIQNKYEKNYYSVLLLLSRLRKVL